jgi:hypothetical protein
LLLLQAVSQGAVAVVVSSFRLEVVAAAFLGVAWEEDSAWGEASEVVVVVVVGRICMRMMGIFSRWTTPVSRAAAAAGCGW